MTPVLALSDENIKQTGELFNKEQGAGVGGVSEKPTQAQDCLL